MAKKKIARAIKVRTGKPAQTEGEFFLNVGHGSYVSTQKVLAILSSDSSPMKRVIHEAEKNRTLMNATHGRKARSVIVLEGGVLILSALNTDTMAHRYGKPESK